jgi:hypothetical protein
MKLIRGLAIAVAALVGLTVVGCSSASLKNGTKKCGANGACPSGYECYPTTNTCYLTGTEPKDGGGDTKPADGGKTDTGTSDAPSDMGIRTDGPTDTGAAPVDGGGDGGVVIPTVTVTIQRNGNGAITGTGVNCTDTMCSITVNVNSSLVLTASPAADSVFNAWSGCTTVNGPACTLTSITDSMQVTATFALKSANVVVVKDGNGTGTVAATWAGGGSLSCGATCSAVVPKNTVLTIQATPDMGSTVSIAGCTGAGPCMVTTGDAETDLKATFTLSTVMLTVARTGNGTITGTGGVSCTNPSCAVPVNYGDSITLTAAPGTDSDFASWTGCTTTSGTMCVVSGVKAAATVTATFTLKKIQVTIQTGGNGTIASADGTVSCAMPSCTVTVSSGSSLSLVATAGSDSDFKSWAGCTTTTGATCALTTITAPATVSATFAIKNASFVISKQGNGSGSVTATWAGGGSLNCGSACSANIPQGTVVTVTGTAGSQSTLALSGLCSGAGPCTLTVPAGGTTVTATFTLVKYALTVQASGSGTVTGTGISCTTFPCTQQLDSGTSVALTAAPAAQYTFTGWSGCSSTSGTICNVTSIAMATAVTATFTLNQYPLTVQVSGDGSVTGPGVNCASASCVTNFNSGSNITLTATAGSTSTFQGWTGGCSTTSGLTCTVSNLTAAAAVTATFVLKNASFNIIKAGNGTGTVTATWAGGGSLNCGTVCAANIPQTTVVTVQGSPGAASSLVFSGACTGAGPCTVTVGPNGVNITATFTLAQYNLTVQANGSGTVTGTGVNCTSFPCTNPLNAGSSIALTATPAGEYNFTGWSGGCTSVTGNVCNVNSISAATTVTATFTLKQYPLTVVVSGHGTVTGSGYNCSANSCVNNFDSGSSVSLTANPGGDSTFVSWTGCSSTSGMTCTVSSLMAAKSVTATFNLINATFTIATGGNGAGKIVATWAGGNSVTCPPNCSGLIPANTVVTLTPTASTGSTFAWGTSTPTGLCSGSGACTVTVGTTAETVGANFTLLQYIVQVMLSGPNGAGSIVSNTAGVNIACGAGGSCAASVNYGTSVQLFASPTSSGAFQSWTSCAGTVSPSTTCTVTVTGASMSTAAFTSANGQPCNAGNPGTCHSGFCVGGVCCNTACGNGNLDSRCGSCSTGTCNLKAPQTYCNTVPGFSGVNSGSDILQFCTANGQCVSPTIVCPYTGAPCNINTSACCYSGSNPDAICGPISQCNGDGAGDYYGGYSCASTATDCPTGYTCCYQHPNANDTGHWGECVLNCNQADPNYGQVLP